MSNPIAEKIRKLIAHEKSARSIGNLAEAEAFASKIQELLIEHKLSVSDVEEASDPLGAEMGRPDQTKRVAETWSSLLAAAIAEGCFCNSVVIPCSNQILFFGRDGDRMVAIAMWRHLRDLALQFAKDDVKKIAALRRRMKQSSIRHRYLMGFATAIAVRLKRDRRDKEASLQQPGLMRLCLAMEQVFTFLKKSIDTRSTKIDTPKDSLAFRAGFQRGINAPLRKQHTLRGGL